jgi:prophage regulatory protein
MNSVEPTEGTYRDAQLLPMKAVSRITSLSRATIYRRIAAGTFPKPINLCGRRVAFAREDVDRWIANPIAYNSDGRFGL